MDAQDSIAAGVLVDLRAQADVNSTIAEALGGDVVDQILRNEIISKELKLEMKALEVAFGIFSRSILRWPILRLEATAGCAKSCPEQR